MYLQSAELEANIGKTFVELVTWENDADHYKSELFVFEPEEIPSIKVALDSVMKVGGNFNNLDFNEAHFELLSDLIGYSYESEYPRTLEYFRVFKLVDIVTEEL